MTLGKFETILLNELIDVVMTGLKLWLVLRVWEIYLLPITSLNTALAKPQKISGYQSIELGSCCNRLQ